jgi:hypothetical protein
MKRIIFIILIVLSNIGCEDVIEVNVPSESPRLIIDAIIRVDESEPVILSVKVSLTSPFFGEVPVANLKQITIQNVDKFTGKVLNETEPGSGIYEVGFGLNDLKGGRLVFQVEHDDQRYLASTYYVPVAPIDTIFQGDGARLEGDQTEIITTFTDNPGRDDFYLFDFDFNEYFTTDDEFYQGQQVQFPYFHNKLLEPGQEVDVSILGADEPFYDYMTQLIDQSKTIGFDPFATPAATVRGNIINVTEIDNIDYYDNVYQTNNFVLGYFAVVQTHTKTITIK